MTELRCPACGCRVAGDAYEKDGVLDCCKPCATAAQCECGCCEAVEDEEAQESE